MKFRNANPDESGYLIEIFCDSKRHWGYEDELIELWRDDMSINEEYIRNNKVVVFSVDDVEIGYFAMRLKERQLDDFFIRCEWIGKGYGREAFEQIKRIMKVHDIKVLKFNTDPNAAGFYERMGENISVNLNPYPKADLSLSLNTLYNLIN